MRKLCIILLCMVSQAFAQGPTLAESFQETTDWLKEKRESYVSGGVYIVGVQNQEIFHKSPSGLANAEHKVPVTDSTIFDLASLAKMFTGYTIATLEEQNLLSTDDDIHKYLPDFPDYGHTITVGHLLHHTSGVKNWTHLLGEMGWDFGNKISFNQLIRLIYAQTELDFKPGERYQYSNSGYNLLVQIIEKVTDQPFEEWTQENIFVPLEMEHTFFNRIPYRIIPNLAQGYYINYSYEDFRDINNLTALGSSSLYSNGTDMSKWLNFLLHPPQDKKQIVQRMFTTRKLNDGEMNAYAYGIEVEDYRGMKFISHSGSWASHTSYLAILPDEDIGIFLIHNFRTNTRGVVELYLDNHFFPKEEEEEEIASTRSDEAEEEEAAEVVLSTAQLDAYLGTFQLGPSWFVTMERRGEELFVQANGESAFPMDPINDSTFRVSAYGNRTITFHRNGTNRVNALTYDGERCPKLNLDAFQKADYQNYEGYYFCKELETVFHFEARDDAFYAKNIRIGHLKMRKITEELFIGYGPISGLKFQKDASGQITGFYTTNSDGEKKWSFIKV